jgi:hypothetical protein
VLKRKNLPNNLVNIIIRLHKNSRIKVKTGSVDSELESSIRVRQASCEGPVLFLFMIQVALETSTFENGVTMDNLLDGNEE